MLRVAGSRRGMHGSCPACMPGRLVLGGERGLKCWAACWQTCACPASQALPCHEAMLAAVLSAGEVLQQVCMAGRSCSMRHLARVQQGGSDGMGIQEAEYESSEEDVPE